MLSFGSGLHYCLGARLATIELEAALCALLIRLPDMKISNLETLNWRPTTMLRGVTSLMATW